MSIFVAKTLMVLQPIFLGQIVDSLSKAFNTQYVIEMIFVFTMMGFISAIMIASKNYFILLFREQLNKDLSIEMVKKFQTFSHPFFHNSNVGKLSQINNSGVEALHGFMVAFMSEIIPFFLSLLLKLSKLSSDE